MIYHLQSMYLSREGGGSKPKLEGQTEIRVNKLFVGNLDPRVSEYVTLLMLHLIECHNLQYTKLKCHSHEKL